MYADALYNTIHIMTFDLISRYHIYLYNSLVKRICLVVDKDFDLADKIPQIFDNEGLQTLDHKRVTIDFGKYPYIFIPLLLIKRI